MQVGDAVDDEDQVAGWYAEVVEDTVEQTLELVRVDEAGEDEADADDTEEQQAGIEDALTDDGLDDADQHHRHDAGVDGAEEGGHCQLRARLTLEADDEIEADWSQRKQIRLPQRRVKDTLEGGGDGQNDGGRTQDHGHHQEKLVEDVEEADVRVDKHCVLRVSQQVDDVGDG